MREQLDIIEAYLEDDLAKSCARWEGGKPEIKEALQALKELREEQDWQSIDSAPKDGTKILTWNGRWQDVSYWTRPNIYTEVMVWQSISGIGHIDQPTHWMHLPELPTGEAE